MTNTDNVPNEEARIGVLRNSQTGTVTNVQVADAVRPYLNLYPFPNAGGTNTAGVGLFAWSGSENTDQNDFLARIDHQLTDEDSLMFRAFYDDSGKQEPGSLALIDSVNMKV